jgi:fructoselysine-6-P-deglycase FrlB-like protein
MSSKLEEAIRAQAAAWREVSERTLRRPATDFPREQPKRVLLFGVGSSHFAARLIAYTLNRDKTRPRLNLVACSSSAIGNEVIPTSGDWAIALSHRGKSEATLSALLQSKRAGAATILVSARGVQAPECADVLLETCELESCEPHTISLTTAVCAVTTYFLGAKDREEWDLIGGVGSPGLEVMRRRAGRGPTVIVGEWEGEWLAREGALKLLEMAKLPVRSYGSEEFFHGPRRALAPDDVVWHVAHNKDPRWQDIPAAYRFQLHGSTPLAWVPALVELQWAALAVALERGVNPDDGV